MRAKINEIIYIVLTEEQTCTTGICGYSVRQLNSIPLLKQKVLQLPSDLTKLARKKSDKLKSSLSTPTTHNIFFLDYKNLISSDLTMFSEAPIVILYDKQIYNDIEFIQLNSLKKPIFFDISNKSHNESYLLTELKTIYSTGLTKKVMQNQDFFMHYDDLILEHYSVNPILENLRNYGVDFTNIQYNYCEPYLKPYIDNIVQINKLVQRLRNDFHIAPSIDIVLSIPPVIKKAAFPYILRNNDKLTEIKKMCNAKTYWDINNQSDLYKREIQYYEICLQLLLEKYFSQLVVLPPEYNIFFNGLISNLMSSSKEKIGNSYVKFVESITTEIPIEFQNLIPDDRIPKVKVYADAPIEFLLDKKNKLPLLLSTTLTKLPTTLGVDSFDLVSINNVDTYIDSDERKIIPVIRSFKNTDPIKNELELAYNYCKKTMEFDFSEFESRISNELNYSDLFQKKENIEFEFYDVNSISELVDILNNNRDKSIVIFDCHGGKGSDGKYGYLKIGNELFNPYMYDNDVYIPPIVLLSACQTFPMGDDTFSVANGFLASNAKCVLGTYSSVSARSSADLIARIFLRLSYFLPIALTYLSEVSLDDFLSMFHRMAFTSDILSHFREKGDISPPEQFNFQKEINILINQNKSTWYSELIKRLIIKTNLSEDELKNYILNNVNYSESLKYMIL